MRVRRVILGSLILALNACGGSGADETVRDHDGSTPSDAANEPFADATMNNFADVYTLDGESGVDAPAQIRDATAGSDAEAGAEREGDGEAATPNADAEAGVELLDADGGAEAADGATGNAADHDAATDAAEYDVATDAGDVDASGLDSGGDVELDAPGDALGNDAADATGSSEASDAGTMPACTSVPPCASKIWTVYSGAGFSGTATVTTCGLHFYNDGPDDALQIQQGPLTAPATLTGDFTVTIAFANFDPSPSPGLFASALLITVNAGGSGSSFYVSAPEGGYEIASYLAAGAGSPSDIVVPAAATSGVATFSRVGATLTATIAAGGAVASQTGTAGTGPLYLRIALTNAASGASSVDITSVDVTGSTGTFQSDAFQCGSL